MLVGSVHTWTWIKYFTDMALLDFPDFIEPNNQIMVKQSFLGGHLWSFQKSVLFYSCSFWCDLVLVCLGVYYHRYPHSSALFLRTQFISRFFDEHTKDPFFKKQLTLRSSVHLPVEAYPDPVIKRLYSVFVHIVCSKISPIVTIYLII